MHGQVEGGVVVFDSAEEVAHLHVDGKFFFEFADKRLLRAFAGFHLAAREFPPVLEITVATLGREDLLGRGSCAVSDDSCHYLDTFHEGKCRKELARRRRKVALIDIQICLRHRFQQSGNCVCSEGTIRVYLCFGMLLRCCYIGDCENELTVLVAFVDSNSFIHSLTFACKSFLSGRYSS